MRQSSRPVLNRERKEDLSGSRVDAPVPKEKREESKPQDASSTKLHETSLSGLNGSSKPPKASLTDSDLPHFSNNSKGQAAAKKVNHHPQILDEDTERFKLRLDDLVNKFKLETITEFMSAKKHLLDEQSSTIMNEKMVAESRFQSKCFEVGPGLTSSPKPKRPSRRSSTKTKDSSSSATTCPEPSARPTTSSRKSEPLAGPSCSGKCSLTSAG